MDRKTRRARKLKNAVPKLTVRRQGLGAIAALAPETNENLVLADGRIPLDRSINQTNRAAWQEEEDDRS
jgi:hypothetical protein